MHECGKHLYLLSLTLTHSLCPLLSFCFSSLLVFEYSETLQLLSSTISYLAK